MWLAWETAFQVAVCLAVVLVALVVIARLRPLPGWLRVVRLTLGEMVLMFTLYGIWQWVHDGRSPRRPGRSSGRTRCTTSSRPSTCRAS